MPNEATLFEQYFNAYITDNKLFTKEDKILVAVSGGIDSMVLANLLLKSGYRIGIAHLNFQLRGAASDGDEAFVADFAAKNNCPLHTKRVDTEGGASESKISIQEAARNLRYAYFFETAQKFDYQYIALAHHVNDNIETVLYKWAKGTGLRGLRGILPKNEQLVRPLLWATRAAIETYLAAEKIDFREDASNATDKYARNFIRHKVIPALKHINPQLEKTVSDNISHLIEAEHLLHFFIEKIKTESIEATQNQWIIDFEKIKTYPSVSYILFEILNVWGFNASQIAQLLAGQKTGTKFYSDTHTLLFDRNKLIINILENKNALFVQEITKEDCLNDNILGNIKLSVWDFEEKKQDISPILKEKNNAFLDFEKLTFPLKLRYWSSGDTFQPFGLGGKHQKVSDFLTQKKISLTEKESIIVLETADNKIAWLVGFRTDERFKINEKTKKVLFAAYSAK